MTCCFDAAEETVISLIDSQYPVVIDGQIQWAKKTASQILREEQFRQQQQRERQGPEKTPSELFREAVAGRLGYQLSRAPCNRLMAGKHFTWLP